MTNVNGEKDSNTNNKRLGIWIIVCSAIFIYLVVSFCVYFFGNNTEIYEVVEGKSESSLNSKFTAIALREESIVPSAGSGYINFFVGDALPVIVGEKVYVLDKNGDLAGQITSYSENSALLNEGNLEKLENTIADFDVSFNEDEYYDAYYFKYKLSSQILDLIYGSNFNLSSTVMSEGDGSITVVTSNTAGIIQHSTDGFENTKVDDIEAASFRKENYEKKIIKSNDFIEEGSAAYKVITSEDWKLVFQLTGNDDWDGKETIKVEFTSDGLVAEGLFETFTRAGNKYGVISLSKYMIRYVSDRFIQIRLINDSVKGLKIPKSSVGSEAFYLIPAEFMTEGGNSSESGFLKQTADNSVKFVSPRIVKNDEKYCYVSRDYFSQGDVIVHPETNVTYKIYAVEELPCVYVYNGGVIKAKPVEIIDEFSGYYIVSDATDYGLKVYDQILRKAADD